MGGRFRPRAGYFVRQHARRAQRPFGCFSGRGVGYPSTLNFGTGLVTVPVAWVSPSSSDFWLSYGATHMNAPPAGVGTPSHWNGNIAIDTHWLQRFDVGLSLYSNNPEWGFFGQVLAVRDGQFASFMPAIAVGVRNLGPFSHEERFLIGGDVAVDSAGQTHEETPSVLQEVRDGTHFLRRRDEEHRDQHQGALERQSHDWWRQRIVQRQRRPWRSVRQVRHHRPRHVLRCADRDASRRRIHSSRSSRRTTGGIGTRGSSARGEACRRAFT